MNKGILILVAYNCEFLICSDQFTTTKALELGSFIGVDYVYFVLIHTVVVVNTVVPRKVWVGFNDQFN